MVKWIRRIGGAASMLLLVIGLIALAILSRVKPPSQHRPVLLISGTRLWGVTRGGILLPQGSFEMRNLPIVSGVDEGNWSGYDTLSTIEIRHALGLVREIEEIDPSWLDLISEIVVSVPGKIKIYLANGVPVELGVGDYDRKARQLWTVLVDLQQKSQRAEEIDLRFAEQVVVRVAR